MNQFQRKYASNEPLPASMLQALAYASSVGLACGYLLSAAQLTDGFANRVGKARRAYVRFCEEQGGDVWDSMSRMASCGWCASPFAVLPAWSAVQARERFEPIQALLGFGVAVAVCAMYRRQADVI